MSLNRGARSFLEVEDLRNSRNYCVLSKLHVWCGLLSSTDQEVLSWSKKRERIFACGRERGARYAGPALAKRNGYYPYRPLLMAGAAGEAGDEVDAAGDVDGDVAAAGDEGDGRFGRCWER